MIWLIVGAFTLFAAWYFFQRQSAQISLNKEPEQPQASEAPVKSWQERVAEINKAQKPNLSHADRVNLLIERPGTEQMFDGLLPPSSEAEANRIGYDWNANRVTLQKIAYQMVGKGVPKHKKEAFTQFMKEFARRDPLYQLTIERVQAAVANTPGMLQSEIYAGRTEQEKEMARYILYFAHELGDIRREKSGNSYKLYLGDGSEPNASDDLFDYQAAAAWTLRESSLSRAAVRKIANAVQSQKYKSVEHALNGKDFDWPWLDQCAEQFHAWECWPDSSAWQAYAQGLVPLSDKEEILAKIPGKELRKIAAQYEMRIPSKAKVGEAREMLEQALTLEQLAPYAVALNSTLSEKHAKQRLHAKYKLLEWTVGSCAFADYRYSQIVSMRDRGYRPAIEWGGELSRKMAVFSDRKIPPFYPGDGSQVVSIPPKGSALERLLSAEEMSRLTEV